jgi:hypothetical protein
MAKPWDITGDDVDLWARRVESPGLLPDLVRRLLLATAPLSSITMNAHAGTRLRGVDGMVRASTETAFCPAGLSVWELTVEETQTKFSRDLTKRTNDAESLVPHDTTYVAVSARRVSGKTRWALGKDAEHVWREVRLLDADDLAVWLTGAPAVARWFAVQLGRPVDDIEDLDAFLEAWRRRTRPPLPPAIALSGQARQRVAEGVRAFARSIQHQGNRSEPLRVHGDTWEEAAVFAAAALALDATPEGEQIRARTVVVRSEAALRSALRTDQTQPLLVIAAFERASASVGPVVLPLDGPLPVTAVDVLRLAPVPYRRFAEVLVEAGKNEHEANRLASASGGQISALQRLLGYVELPRWAQGLAAPPLSAMLLAGAFEPGNPEDRDVLELLGADGGEVELLCERLRVGADAPTLKEQGRRFRPVWRWRSPHDAWRVLAGQIPAAALRGFEEATRLVLGERDPQLDLAADQRFAAALHGKTLRASGALRDGLVRSVVHLALSDDALAPLHGAQRGSLLAKLLVRDLLPPPWAAWASLAPLLPLLAEAAPEMFLDCLEASLREGDVGAAHLLVEESSFGGSPHTGLLWALETLGWDEALLPRVAAALASLAQHDAKLARPGRLANRPKASLDGILRIALAQTCAPARTRIEEMTRRLQKTPDIGFPLLVEQIAALSGGSMLPSGHRPELWPHNIPSHDDLVERTNRELTQVANAYLDMALDYVDNSAERWAYFLRQVRVGLPSIEDEALRRLEAVLPRIADEGADLWGALRHVLHWARREENTTTEGASAEPDDRVVFGRWQQLYKAFEPSDLGLRYAWLFLRPVELPDGFRAHTDLEADGQEIRRRQADAIEDIGRQDDRLQILGALGEKVGEESLLGWAMASAPFTHELDARLIDQTPPKSLSPQVPTYLAARWRVEGSVWFEAKARTMVAQGRTQELKKTFRVFSGTTEIWDLVDALGEEVWRSYWQDLEYVFGDHSAEEWERALKSLLAVGNTVGALLNAQCAKEKINSDTIAEALKALLLADPRQVMRADDHGVSSWVLEQLMDRLEAAPEVESKYAQLLANVELVYALHTYDPKRPTRRLSAAFAANPDQFVDLVAQMYRPKGEPRPERSEAEQAEVEQRGMAAHRVLNAWTGYPGQGLPADECETVLYDWSLKALHGLVAVNRAETGASEVGNVLVRAPVASDSCFALMPPSHAHVRLAARTVGRVSASA